MYCLCCRGRCTDHVGVRADVTARNDGCGLVVVDCGGDFRTIHKRGRSSTTLRIGAKEVEKLVLF